jgi:hypothetical protein
MSRLTMPLTVGSFMISEVFGILWAYPWPEDIPRYGKMDANRLERSSYLWDCGSCGGPFERIDSKLVIWRGKV